ncbi:hypothetical protein [Microtetraspora malaysiensis]|uniref:Uncharacterized protein n=1 Tax=Microtetraspora malaysiensis TaxID=161358 RepID=A0ABW6SMH7_9ACTN
MPAKCWNSVRGRVMRATRVDNCGNPVIGPCSQVVTKGFVKVSYSPEIAEGEEIELRRADGQLCVSDQGCPELKWLTVEIEFCQVDPDLFSMITGYPTVLDWQGDAVGTRITSKVECDSGVALEVWSDVPGAPCSDGGLRQYGYFLLPWIVNGIIGDLEIGNDATTFTLTGKTKKGGNWGVGPYMVDPTDGASPPTAGPLLTPIGPDEHMDLHLTTVAPPEDACGCQPLA